MPIDVHCHFIPPAYVAAVRKEGNPYRESIAHDAKTGLDVLTAQNGLTYHLVPQLCDIEAMAAEQGKLATDFTVLSPPPSIIHDWLESSVAREHCRMVNESMAEIQRQFPNNFACLGMVPMQDTAAAVAELDYACNELGLRGIILCTNVAGRNLDEPDFLPVFQRAAQLHAAILLHPWYVAGADRMRRYHLFNAVGNPMELAIGVGHLIFGRVIDQAPGLKLLIVHAGGAVPYIIGRLERAWHIRPEVRSQIEAPPSSYLPRFWYDTIAHDADAISFLINKAGTDKIMLGSDSPFHLFDMGDPTPLQTLNRMQLAPDVARQIGDGNARSFFGLTELGGTQ